MRSEQADDDRPRAAFTPVALQVPSLVDALYAEIRERILTGALPGGSSVTEMDLASQYSVARPTAKASMERLVHEGLLRRGSHKTAKVPVLNVEDIRDLYYSRACLEREVMAALAEKRLVPEAARTSLQELQAGLALMEVVNLDVAFHSSLVDALGSPRLNRLYRSLMAEVRLCMAQVQANHLLTPGRIANEHAAILKVIENGDVEGVVKRITEHLDRACTRLITHVETMEDSGQKNG